MIKLLQDSGAVSMYRIGYLAEMGNDRIIAVTKITACEYRRGVHRHRLDHDHGGPTARAFFVVTTMAFAGQAHFRHVGGVRTEHDAVVELAMTQFERLEHIGIVSHGWQFNPTGVEYNHCFCMNKTIYFHDFHRNQS